MQFRGLFSGSLLSFFFLLSNQAFAQEAPEISWMDQNGTHTVSEYRGQPLILHFWASWCTSCRHEMPDVSIFVNKGIGNAKFIALSLDKSLPFAKSSMDTLNPFGASLPVGVTGRGSPGAFGFRAIPSTVIIDGTGKIVAKYNGAAPWLDAQLAGAVKQLQ